MTEAVERDAPAIYWIGRGRSILSLCSILWASMKNVKSYFSTVIFLIGVVLSAIACGKSNISTSAEGTIFEGHYVTKFEVSSFVPCGNDQLPGYGSGYWLVANPDSNFFEQYETIISNVPSNKRREEIVVYARFIGELSPTRPVFSGYGHLGLYTNIITVTKVFDVSLDQECQNE